MGAFRPFEATARASAQISATYRAKDILPFRVQYLARSVQDTTFRGVIHETTYIGNNVHERAKPNLYLATVRPKEL